VETAVPGRLLVFIDVGGITAFDDDGIHAKRGRPVEGRLGGIGQGHRVLDIVDFEAVRAVGYLARSFEPYRLDQRQTAAGRVALHLLGLDGTSRGNGDHHGHTHRPK
jgi:hypothetical protein